MNVVDNEKFQEKEGAVFEQEGVKQETCLNFPDIEVVYCLVVMVIILPQTGWDQAEPSI